MLRKNVEPYEQLGLAGDRFTDDQLIDSMLQHPILINRPIVVTPLGTRLCRPSEVVLDILPDAQKGAFTKEDGEAVVDAGGKKISGSYPHDSDAVSLDQPPTLPRGGVASAVTRPII